MRALADLRILYRLALGSRGSATHAGRMESFYRDQAEDYDGFRRALLQGREELIERIEPPEGAIWVDMGGGTGANLEALAGRIERLGSLHVVDLSPSLLAVAERRIQRRGWRKVRTVLADATCWRPPRGRAHVVTFSYSLTMIPDWFAALENAWAMLEPGGLIGVVDFYVSRKYPPAGFVRHGGWTRAFWPLWFGWDDVFPSSDHAPYLHRLFEPVHFAERRARLPYLPLRAPYFLFVGRKRCSSLAPERSQ